MVQRRVGQHDPQLPLARRHRLRDRPRSGVRAPGAAQAATGQPGQQHDRPPRAAQHLRRRLVHLAQFPRRRDVGHHHGERLVLAVLALPQRRRGLLCCRVDGQVVAAQPLDGQDGPAPQQFRRRGDHPLGRPLQGAAVRPEQGQRGAAHRAAGRFGMKPPVPWIPVLLRAGRAHGEPGHRGPGPVVRDVPDDGEPRPAVRAVDERIAEPPVTRVGQLTQAVRARRGVGRHQGLPGPARRAGHDGEGRQAVRRYRPAPHPVDPGQRRGVAL